MVSENEKKLKRENLLLQQQISQKDSEIFKLTNKNRNLKRENEKVKEDSEKQKNVHNIRLKRIHQRRKFKVADYEKEKEKLVATIKRLKRDRNQIIPTSSNIITNCPSTTISNVTHRRKQMLVDKEIFDKLCPSYQNVVKELHEKYAAISEENYVTKLEIFKEFFHYYFMLPQLWDKLFSIYADYDEWIGPPYSLEEFNFLNEVREESRYDNKISYYQFYDNQSPFCKKRMLIHKKPNLTYFPENPYTLKEIEARLICPQTDMDNTFRSYDEFSGKPITKQILQKFQNAKKLYEEIVKSDNDQIKWFNLLIQCKNDDFVCDNIDFRLGKDLNNLELWKLYFDFLKKIQNTKRLLHLYSRYCRYFLEDLKMKEEYKEATEKYGPVKVFWKNTFNFEIFDENPDFFLLSNINGGNESESSRKIVKASFESYEKPIFSFPKTIISYITINGSPNILHNLHKTCKYFFVFRPYPVCHRLWYSRKGCDSERFHGQSLTIYTKHDFNDANLIFEHKVIISYCFHVNRIYLSKIYQCNAKYIRFAAINISFKELNFLVGHGNVESLVFQGVEILNEDNTLASLEEILKLLPKISVFETDYPITTLRTFEILPTLEFKNKFNSFSLSRLTYLESYGYCEFLKKNLDFNSFCEVVFDKKLKNAVEMKNIIEKELKNHWPEHLRPLYYIQLPSYY